MREGGRPAAGTGPARLGAARGASAAAGAASAPHPHRGGGGGGGRAERPDEGDEKAAARCHPGLATASGGTAVADR